MPVFKFSLQQPGWKKCPSWGVGMCGKSKFGSDSVYKKRTNQKFDTRSEGFP